MGGGGVRERRSGGVWGEGWVLGADEGVVVDGGKGGRGGEGRAC